MRQQRQASQEVLQRKAALQRIADRRQNSRSVLLDSSSDSECSVDSYRSGSPASSIQSRFRNSSNFTPAVESSQSEHKSLQRLSQHKENRPETHLPAVANVTAKMSNLAATVRRMSADGDKLASSLAGLAIADNANKKSPAAAVLAAAVATDLPGEASDSSSRALNSDTAEEAPDQSSKQGIMQAAGLHIAEFQLKAKTANMLYKHQIEGVKWLWSLHKMRRGGILGQCLSSAHLQVIGCAGTNSCSCNCASPLTGLPIDAGDDMGLGKVTKPKPSSPAMYMRGIIVFWDCSNMSSKSSTNCPADNAVLCFPGRHVWQWSGKVCAKLLLGNSRPTRAANLYLFVCKGEP